MSDDARPNGVSRAAPSGSSGDNAAERLAAIQLALAAAVTGGCGGAQAAAAGNAVLGAIVPGGTLDAAGALGVYRSGYVARLTDQLGETYPSVWRLLGDEDFFAAAAAYIDRHPSTSYNLSDYGCDFAGFLAATAEVGEAQLLAELAGFEWVFHGLFHALPQVPVPAAELAAVGDLEGVRLQLGSAVRLLACRRAVYEVFRHRHRAEVPDLDLERPQWILLFKQGSDVLAREIDEASFAALAALQKGLCAEEAIAAALERAPAWSEAEVAGLFGLLSRCGLVAAILR